MPVYLLHRLASWTSPLPLENERPSYLAIIFSPPRFLKIKLMKASEQPVSETDGGSEGTIEL
jgi:hypothetical protein